MTSHQKETLRKYMTSIEKLGKLVGAPIQHVLSLEDRLNFYEDQINTGVMKYIDICVLERTGQNSQALMACN